MVADAAHDHEIWVGVCGEMAGDLALTPLLLGLGMDELSVGASLVPRVKRAVQSLTHGECQKLVGEVMELDTSAAILRRCTEMAQTHYGELLG
jgi:phosphotransferase system enzyme I (PtsI)